MWTPRHRRANRAASAPGSSPARGEGGRRAEAGIAATRGDEREAIDPSARTPEQPDADVRALARARVAVEDVGRDERGRALRRGPRGPNPSGSQTSPWSRRRRRPQTSPIPPERRASDPVTKTTWIVAAPPPLLLRGCEVCSGPVEDAPVRGGIEIPECWMEVMLTSASLR